jgi:hypothetical protein
MEDNRVELKYYDPILSKVVCPVPIGRDFVPAMVSYTEGPTSLLRTTLHVKTRPGSTGKFICRTEVIDLNTIDLSKFNQHTRRWKARVNPSVITFLDLLASDSHPLCFVPKWCIGNRENVISYLSDELIKERDNIIEYTNCSDSTKNELLFVDGIHVSSDTGAAQQFYRFQTVERRDRTYNITPVYKRLTKMLNYFGYYSHVNTYGSLPRCEVTYTLVDGEKVPVLSQDDKENALYKAQSLWSPRNQWNYDPPDEVEFEDNTEMLEKVKEHLSMIKGLKITYLRKRMLAYYSDGYFSTSPDAAPKGYCPPFLDSYKNFPLLYSGEAWTLHFTVNDKDYQHDNFIYFCTPEQYVKAMTSMGRGDLVENWEPWSDLLWISSDWCERNGKVNYNKGIDLSTPHRRRLSLAAWILGPFTQKCIEIGLGNPLEGFATIVSPKFNRNRWRAVAVARKALSEYNKVLSQVSI